MKRGGRISSNEPDKKKPAVDGVAARTRSATRAASFKLTDFADEILVQVCSFLCFKDRQVTRRSSRRLLEFVDESTPGADKLSIYVTAKSWTPGNRPFAVSMRRDFEHPDSSVRVYVDVLDGLRLDAEADTSLVELIQSSFPPLHNIRPGTFSLQIESTTTCTIMTSVFAGLTQYLVDQQVPRSVTEIVYFNRLPYQTRSEVEQVFSSFELLSQSGVQKLKLQPDVQDSPDAIQSAAICLSRLVSLSVSIDSDDSLQALVLFSGHPTLREVVVRYTNREVHLMTALETFRNIRKLDYAWESENEEHFNAFGNMIRGMENLECLRRLCCPSVKFWQHLTKSSVVSNSLQKLAVTFAEPGLIIEICEAMLEGLQAFAPSLTTLRFQVLLTGSPEWNDHKICLLSGLRQHPTLNTLELERVRPFALDALSSLKQELGSRVKVVTVITP